MMDNIKKIYHQLIENRLELLVLTAIVGIPLAAVIPLQGTDVWYVQYLALFSAFIIGIVFYLLGFNRFLALFLLSAWHSTVFTASQNPRAMLILFQITFGLMAIKLISSFDQKTVKRLFIAVVVSSILSSIYNVIQFFNIDPIFDNIQNAAKDDTVGFLGSHNQLGVFMSVTAPAILQIFPWALPLNIFAIFCSKTASSWAGFVAGTFFLVMFAGKNIIKSVRPIFIAGLILLILSLVYFKKYEGFSPVAWGERLNLYRHTITSVLKEKIYLNIDDKTTIVKTCKKWFGYGLGSFTAISPRSQTYFLNLPSKQSHRYEHAHNDYLETLFELGIIGFVILTMIILDLIIKFVKAKKTIVLIIASASLLAHGVNSLGIYAVQTAPSGMLLILFLGIFYGEIIRQKKDGIYAC